MAERPNQQPIIVKRKKILPAGHHGGAWKVAYADFVTAMMAFFLLLWLLNVTSEDQKLAIAQYFDPTSASQSNSGAGGMLGGQTMTIDGARISANSPILSAPNAIKRATGTGTAESGEQSEGQDGTADKGGKVEDDALAKALEAREKKQFDAAEKTLREAMQQSPELAKLAEHLMVDQTPEGLRVQIVDDEGESMFPLGSAQMFDHTRQILALVAKVVNQLPNKISVRGHTDSRPYAAGAGYDNWNLSADRANASRRALVENGVPAARVENVVGRADREALMPADPANPRNRRISIILLKQALVGAAGDPPRPAASPVPEGWTPDSD